MLFFNRHIRSLPSEGWICNFEVVWLYHLFHRAEFIERVVAQYGPCEYGNRQSFKCQLTSSYEGECNCCWPDICQGPWEGLWGPSPKRRPHSLLSFVAWTNCKPYRTTFRTIYSFMGLTDLLRSSFNIGPAKTPSLSWRISCVHFVLVLFTLVLTNTVV